MERPTASVVAYVGAAVLVAAVLSGYPARWFRSARTAELNPITRRAAVPDFTLPALEGGSWRLGEHAGRVVVLNFWATWCGPCREETPEFVRIYQRYRSRGLEIAGIALDEDPHAVVPSFVRRFGVPYPVLLPGPDFVLSGYVEHLPTTLTLDRRGRIAWSWIGRVSEDQLVDAIERLLEE
ncbi:MAG TPA: TlpA disulfide reductase family protein [Bryobacteraceae bacterium]|nr:TlpA disulfide reductase family protein [Bryobacteraceae bacterium]